MVKKNFSITSKEIDEQNILTNDEKCRAEDIVFNINYRLEQIRENERP